MRRLHRISIAMTSLSRPLKVRRRRGTFSPLLVVAGILLGLATVVRIHRFAYEERVDHYSASEQDGGDGNSKLLSSSSSSPPPVSFVSAGIRVHREQIDGRDVLWASPQDNDRGTIKGLLFLAHGCGHSNLDWFARTTDSSECEDCVGLPEEVAIVQTALDMGLVAIALSSSNWKTKCWNRFDVTPVALVLNELWHRFSQAERTSTATAKKPTNTTSSLLEDKEQPPRLPLYAFGASSGGTFVSTLASPLLSRFGIRLDGFVSQIAAQLPLLKEDQEEPKDLCRVYVTMNRDSKTDRAAQARVEKCHQQPPSTTGSSSSHERKTTTTHASNDDRCKHIRLPPLPIKPEYFADRIPDLSPNESYEMVKILTKHGFLRPDTGALMEDPRKTHGEWSQTLNTYAAKPRSELAFLERGDALRKNQSPIFEVLNVAWGYHEMSREGVKEALEFCIQDKSQTTEE